ncbi:hypothetical protein ACFOZY_14345 [Chungangia koreensis]|uniref:Activator of Hsp90 ATPase homolog 1-like protein n=1 Tax=Chungangia koreensis TaxID=752657 RepID=A0ABV8X9G3_9LACT
MISQVEKQVIDIDTTPGKRKFDMERMNEWTKEEWEAWVGTPEDHQGIQIDLLDEHDFYIRISGIGLHEPTRETIVWFDVENRKDTDIQVRFKWIQTDQIKMNVEYAPPVILEAGSTVKDVEVRVPDENLGNWIHGEFQVFENETNHCIRDIVFNIKIYHD